MHMQWSQKQSKGLASAAVQDTQQFVHMMYIGYTSTRNLPNQEKYQRKHQKIKYLCGMGDGGRCCLHNFNRANKLPFVSTNNLTDAPIMYTSSLSSRQIPTHIQGPPQSHREIHLQWHITCHNLTMRENCSIIRPKVLDTQLGSFE